MYIDNLEYALTLKENIEVLIAFHKGQKIQFCFKDSFEVWTDFTGHSPNVSSPKLRWRIKSSLYKPFTFETAFREGLVGKSVFGRGISEYKVSHIGENSVNMINVITGNLVVDVSYNELFSDYTFKDSSQVGRK